MRDPSSVRRPRPGALLTALAEWVKNGCPAPETKRASLAVKQQARQDQSGVLVVAIDSLPAGEQDKEGDRDER